MGCWLQIGLLISWMAWNTGLVGTVISKIVLVA
jgi:hypothetical protein